jgi:hypothetical protein
MCSIAVGSGSALPDDRLPDGRIAEGPAAAGLTPEGGAEQRIAEIGRAIDDLANMTGPTGLGDTSPIVARVAELWGLLAELDPEVARRLAGYQALSNQQALSAVPAQSDLANRGTVSYSAWSPLRLSRCGAGTV